MDGTRIDCHYNLYLHHLGTTADRAGLDRLNRRRAHKGYTQRGPVLMTPGRFASGSQCRALSEPCYRVVELRVSWFKTSFTYESRHRS